MSVYVGIDVHRKRSQLAVVDEAGQVLVNRNVPNGVETILPVIGDLPIGTSVASRPRSAGDGWSSCSRTTGSIHTWCTRRSARRSPRPG
jgi:transposase